MNRIKNLLKDLVKALLVGMAAALAAAVLLFVSGLLFGKGGIGAGLETCLLYTSKLCIRDTVWISP